MKKLGKLYINPEKRMKNEELLSLRGGYGTCYACWGEGGFIGHVYGTGLTYDEAMLVCNYSYAPLVTTDMYQTECP